MQSWALDNLRWAGCVGEKIWYYEEMYDLYALLVIDQWLYITMDKVTAPISETPWCPAAVQVIHVCIGMGIENRFLFRTGSQWTDSLETSAKFFNDSVNGSLCRCPCANLLIQTATNMLAFWITSDWGEWDWWWNNSSWEGLLSFLSNTTVLVFRSSVSLGASG